MSRAEADLFGMLLAVPGGPRLLLPRNVVIEVQGWQTPEPLVGAPGWLAGRLRWQEADIPVLSLAHLFGKARPLEPREARLVIWQALDGALQPAAYAVICKGFPTLVDLTPAMLAAGQLGGTGGRPVAGRISLGRVEAVVPDLSAIERALARALGRAS